MKKSTGILLFVVFIFIIMVLNSKKTEHFLGDPKDTLVALEHNLLS